MTIDVSMLHRYNVIKQIVFISFINHADSIVRNNYTVISLVSDKNRPISTGIFSLYKYLMIYYLSLRTLLCIVLFNS